MIPVLRVKKGVSFTTISPGGFRILSAFDHLAIQIDHDITITSACDGTHSGPDDPHHKGAAYDIRTHDLMDKHAALTMIKESLGDKFFAWIEDEDGENEHIHVQIRKGTIYPPGDAEPSAQPLESPSTLAGPEASSP